MMGQVSAASFPVMAVVGLIAFFFVVMMIAILASHRGRKLKILEEALRSGAIDPQTKRVLLNTLMGRDRVPWLYRVGWFGLFAAGAMLFTEAPDQWSWRVGIPWWTTAIFVFALSLGAVTLPFAVRELQNRRDVVAGSRSD